MILGKRTLTETTIVVAGALFFLFRVLALATGWPFVRGLSNLALACLILVALVWAFRVVWRRFFWSVGRRLAFSYFVVGVLPLGMMVLLFVLAGYLAGGFLLGHLYRDATDELAQELTAAAETRLADASRRNTTPEALVAHLAFAEYARGKKTGGSPEAPATWPDWLEASTPAAADDEATGREAPPLFAVLRDGRITAAAVARSGDRGVVTFYDGDLAKELRERTRVWVELLRDDDPRRKSTTRLQILGLEVRLGSGAGLRRTPEQDAEFFRLNPPKSAGEPTISEKPILSWMESNGPMAALADGAPAADDLAASLACSPATLFSALLSTSAAVDSAAWIALAGLAVLFAEIYLVAASIAVVMIYGLSRAVNRLSQATAAVGAGDFATRIPVRRKDQLGEVQRSFNEMTEHLQELVQTAAQKEALDKELALAREVQRDLLPAAIDERPGVEFATHFEPSAAIGGDYFDILDAKSRRLAVIVADVAGHGLAAGLRMAMVKSAMSLQIEDGTPSAQIFERVHRLLRSLSGERTFVTASLSVFDARTGRLVLTNAGHPPAYVLRAAGEVEELVAPSLPLGTIPSPPGRIERTLAPGDSVVWLSDGLIEAADAFDRQLGFPAVEQALGGPATSAIEVRDRLLAAVRKHVGGRPADDDRTLVVMRYLEVPG